MDFREPDPESRFPEPAEDREHILSRDCWCNPTVESFAPDDDQ